MSKYQLVAFFQGDEATPYLQMLENEGESAVINELSQLDPTPETRETPFWGESDDVYEQGNYFL